MAKYTSTSMEFFLKLPLREGMAYFTEVSQMMQEEQDRIDSSTKPPPFDVSAWHKWQQ